MSTSTEQLDRFNNEVARLPFTSIQKVRQSLPRELFEIQGYKFVLKFLLAFGIIAGMVALFSATSSPWRLISIPVLGLMFAHLVELQHECLHEHAFRSRKLNRFFGFLCGIFMFSSYWHYKYDHLRHHAYLGTSQNYEHFDYKHADINNLPRLMLAAFSLSRYRLLARRIFLSLLNTSLEGVSNAAVCNRIKSEYRLLLLIFALASVAATVSVNLEILFFCWIVPALFVAEPVHFLIETPLNITV